MAARRCRWYTGAGTITAAPGPDALIPDNAHQPSLAYVPYLLTGDRYYADEMAFWADLRDDAAPTTATACAARSGILADNEARGFGWALRNIADAAAYHPEASPVRALSRREGASTICSGSTTTRTRTIPPSNPLQGALDRRCDPKAGGSSRSGSRPTSRIAIDRANRLGFIGGLAASRRDRQPAVEAVLERTGLSPRDDRSTVSCSPDGTVVPGRNRAHVECRRTSSVPERGPAAPAVRLQQTMAEIWPQTSNPSLQRNFAGYYGPEARLNLMLGDRVRSDRRAAGVRLPVAVHRRRATSGARRRRRAFRIWRSAPAGRVDFATGTVPPPPPPSSTPAAQLLTPAAGATFGSSVAEFHVERRRRASRATSLDLGTTQGGVEPPRRCRDRSRSPRGHAAAGQRQHRLGSAVVEDQRRPAVHRLQLHQLHGAGDRAAACAAAPRRDRSSRDGNSTVQTAPFNAAAGDLLVAFVSSSGPDPGVRPETMTVTAGGGLAWTLVARANTQHGVSEIWTATTRDRADRHDRDVDAHVEHEGPVAGGRALQRRRRASARSTSRVRRAGRRRCR